MSLEPIGNEAQQLVESDDSNNNSLNLRPLLHRKRDEIFLEFFGSTLPEFLKNCGLSEDQATRTALALTNKGLDVNDMPLLTMSALSQIVDDQVVVLKIVQRITAYYLTILSNLNN